MRKPEVSCVFPVHNEAVLLRRSIISFIQEWEQKHLPSTEIILVENGSKDNSGKVIASLQKKYSQIKSFKLHQTSYGQAIKTGLLAAKGKIIFIFNVDFFDLEFAVNSLRLLKAVDIVIGSKTLAASRDQRSQFRQLTTYFFNVLLRLVLNYPGTDTHGIKAIKNTPLLTYTINRCRTKNELFDTELVIRATRWGASLLELPVTVREIRPTRYPFFRRIWLTLQDLFVALWSKYLGIVNFEKKVVVADDYGISPPVNQAILAAADKREVQIVSILSNLAKTKDLTLLKKRRSLIKFSLHFNCVEGKPLAPKGKVSSLINSQGKFFPLPIFLIRLLLGIVKPTHIDTEFNYQIRFLKTNKMTIEHLDSHQHIHAFSPLWNRLVHKCTAWEIAQIRSQDSIRFALRPHPLKYLIYLAFTLALSLRYGFSTSSPNELNEIVVHPGAGY